MKYLYIVGFWIPLGESSDEPPTDEPPTGGFLNVIAASDEDCLGLIEKAYDGHLPHGMAGSGRKVELEEAIKEAKKFELSDAHENEEQRIVVGV